MKKGEDPDKTTFTKIILIIVMMLFFVGAIIGSFLVVMSAYVDIALGREVNAEMFVAYAAYIGGPTATAIGFYAWKSKAENLLKIKNTKTAELIANMRGE